jgi:hypothetical protein
MGNWTAIRVFRILYTVSGFLQLGPLHSVEPVNLIGLKLKPLLNHPCYEFPYQQVFEELRYQNDQQARIS